mmetsp:Transcript_118655/g.378213  ORF Transcript_118655/g.378213 Transcript_118655/m.378213 type:complete len:306 (+) Transcript_118655:720-1637(+)
MPAQNLRGAETESVHAPDHEYGGLIHILHLDEVRSEGAERVIAAPLLEAAGLHVRDGLTAHAFRTRGARRARRLRAGRRNRHRRRHGRHRGRHRGRRARGGRPWKFGLLRGGPLGGCGEGGGGHGGASARRRAASRCRPQGCNESIRGGRRRPRRHRRALHPSLRHRHRRPTGSQRGRQLGDAGGRRRGRLQACASLRRVPHRQHVRVHWQAHSRWRAEWHRRTGGKLRRRQFGEHPGLVLSQEGGREARNVHLALLLEDCEALLYLPRLLGALRQDRDAVLHESRRRQRGRLACCAPGDLRKPV